MTKLSELISDDYNSVTLTTVAAAVVAPAIAVAAILGFDAHCLVGLTVLGFEIALVPLWLVTNTIRDAGKNLASRIFASGMPTTRALRLRECSGYETNSRRALVERHSHVQLLSREAELSDPDDADQRIVIGIDIIKEQMRDPERFKLLRRELKSYGFWRNIVAVRWWGLGVAAASACISTAVAWHSGLSTLSAAALCISLLGCVYWILVPSKRRVTQAADRYMEQFYKSLTTL